MKIKFRITLILCLINVNIALSQNIDSVYNMAINSMKNNCYNNAIYYFQRVLCFGDNNIISKTYLPVADCYFSVNQYDIAFTYYNLAYINSIDSIEKQNLIFKKAGSLIIIKKYSLALIELFDNNFNDENFNKRKNLYTGAAYFLLDSFDLAFAHFNSLVINNVDKQNELKEFHKKIIKLNKISPKKIARRSYIIPGIGQASLGYYKEAVNSVMLISAFTALGAVIGFNYGWIDAFLAISPWIYRYYKGGIENTKTDAGNMILEQKEKIYFDIIKLLEN